MSLNQHAQSFLFVFALSVGAVSQQVFQVPLSYPTIQGAINAASSGDTIAIAPGVFAGPIDLMGKELRIIGSDVGQTILAGGAMGTLITIGNGEGPNTLIEGLTIKNGVGSWGFGGGAAVWSPPPQTGGGTYATFRRCRFESNSAALGGSAVMLGNKKTVFEDCTFVGNSGTSAISIQGYDPQHEFTRCQFMNNSANKGGAVTLQVYAFSSGYGPGGNVKFTDCFFSGNHTVSNSFFGTNQRGGAVYLRSGNLRFRRCVFKANTSYWGGVVATENPMSAGSRVFENCLFFQNYAQSGSVLLTYGGAAETFRFTHCTMDNNPSSGPVEAVKIVNAMSSAPGLTFENCILRRASPTAQPIHVSNPSSSVVVTHCDIAGGWTGTGMGNFDLPPLFEYSGSGDYRLRPGSPCVDAGMMPSDPTLVTDFEGDPRPLYGGYDVGYDECGDFALATAAAGTVGLSATGQAADILFVNGSTGGVERHVDVFPGQPMTLSVSLPVTHPPGADFVLYGYLGIADYKTVATLPSGLPSMVFPPCDLFAAMSHPELFTLAGSVAGLSCPPVFFAPGGAPWSSGAIIPGVSGVTFGIQALIVEDLVGTIAASNAVEVRLL